VASFWYTNAVTKMMSRDATLAIDLDGDTIKIGLSGSAHVPNRDDIFLTDGGDGFDVGEFNGVGYVGGFAGSGRKTLAGKTMASDLSTDRAKFDADDPSVWVGFGAGTIAQASIFKEITSNAASPELVNLDFPDVAPATNDFSVTFHADGIGYVQC
jgi:hypothetical protein